MLRATTILLLLGAAAPPARAGWLTVKNDTDKTVVLESAEACPLKKAKPVRLLPGETYREYRLVPGERKVQLLDGSQAGPAQPLGQGTLAWKLADQTLHITSHAAGRTPQWTLAEPAAKAEAVARAR